MNEKLIQILDKLEKAATAYENEHADEYADEILRLQEERKRLENEIKSNELEINKIDNRENEYQANFDNSFNTIFTTFYEASVEKEKEAEEKFSESKKILEESPQVNEDLRVAIELSEEYENKIAKLNSNIQFLKASPSKNIEVIKAMEKELTSLKEELNICLGWEKEHINSKRQEEVDYITARNLYITAKEDRKHLNAEYHAYKQGYDFQYGEKKDGSGEIELQLIPRKKRNERQKLIYKTNIDMANEEIKKINEREEFLSISVANKKEKIIEMIKNVEDYDKIEDALNELSSYIADKQDKEKEEQLISSINSYKEELANKDYVNRHELRQDQERKKQYEERLKKAQLEIEKLDQTIKQPTTFLEEELSGYKNLINYYNEKKQDLLKQSLLLTTNNSMSVDEIKRNKTINEGIKDINKKIAQLELEQNRYRKLLEGQKQNLRNRALYEKSYLTIQNRELEDSLKKINQKLSDKNNYTNAAEKLIDLLKLRSMEKELSEIQNNDKYLKESKEELIKQFKDEYQKSKGISPERETKTKPIDPKTNTFENNVIGLPGETITGEKVGDIDQEIIDKIKKQEKKEISGPTLGNEPIGLPGETITGEKVGDIDQEIIDKIKKQEKKEISGPTLGNEPIGLPGETITGEKVGDIDQEIIDKIKKQDSEKLTKDDNEEIEEIENFKDIGRKLKNAIKDLLRKHPKLTAITTAIVIGVGALGFGSEKEAVATGNVVTETTLPSKDDETSKIGDEYIGKEGERVHESSDFDFGGANKTGLAEGINEINAISFIDKNTGEILGVERTEGTSIEASAKANNLDLDNVLIRAHLKNKGWVDIDSEDLKNQMSKESTTVQEEYGFTMTDAQIKDGKIVLHDDKSGDTIEISKDELSKGDNKINDIGSDGRTYKGNVEVKEQIKLDENGTPVKNWSFENVKDNVSNVIEKAKTTFSTSVASNEAIEQAKVDLINNMVEEMAKPDYNIDLSVDNTNVRGRI